MSGHRNRHSSRSGFETVRPGGRHRPAGVRRDADLNLGIWRMLAAHGNAGPGGFDVTAPSS
jgi:hypothetical protein